MDLDWVAGVGEEIEFGIAERFEKFAEQIDPVAFNLRAQVGENRIHGLDEHGGDGAQADVPDVGVGTGDECVCAADVEPG